MNADTLRLSLDLLRDNKNAHTHEYYVEEALSLITIVLIEILRQKESGND